MTDSASLITPELLTTLASAGRVLLLDYPHPGLVEQLLHRGVDCWVGDSRMVQLEQLQEKYPALPKRLVRWHRWNPAEFAGSDVIVLPNPLPAGLDAAKLISQCASMANRLILMPDDLAFATSASATDETSAIGQPTLSADQLQALLASLGWQVRSMPATGHSSPTALIATRTPPQNLAPREGLKFSMTDALLWCMRSQVISFGVPMATVTWGYEWIRRHLEVIGLAGKTLVDLGSGQSNPLIYWYSERAEHSYLVDLINPANPLPRTQTLVADLEKPLPLPDGSCDLAVSVSVLEHLTPAGRLLQMREIGRVLKPGGHALITTSNLFHLDADALDALHQEPWLNTRGNQISAPLDVAAMLSASSVLVPASPITSRQFPGFEGYDPSRVLSEPDLLTMNVASCYWATFQPRTDALAIPWAEVGMHLVRK